MHRHEQGYPFSRKARERGGLDPHSALKSAVHCAREVLVLDLQLPLSRRISQTPCNLNRFQYLLLTVTPRK